MDYHSKVSFSGIRFAMLVSDANEIAKGVY